MLSVHNIDIKLNQVGINDFSIIKNKNFLVKIYFSFQTADCIFIRCFLITLFP